MQFINYNGELISAKEPVLSVANRAFHYGDALFETIRVLNGVPLFLEDHYNRLCTSAKLLEMQISISKEAFHNEIMKLLIQNEISFGGRIRLTLMRNDGGLYGPETNETSFVLEAVGLETNLFQLNEHGLTIDLYEKHKKVMNELSTLKSTNCLTYILAAQSKKSKNIDDCVLLNELGSIAECVSSNLFVGYNGVLYTPSINQGIIPGIMRQNIINLSKEMNIEVQECPLSPQVLIRADEVFLTNAINGIQWVGAYRNKRYFNKTSKLLTEKLNRKTSLMKGQQEISSSLHN